MSGLIWIQTAGHWWYSQKNFKVDFWKKSADNKKAWKKFPDGEELNALQLEADNINPESSLGNSLFLVYNVCYLGYQSAIL